MKRDNLFIYVGTVIFFILAIALGIIMYMFSKTNQKLENDTGRVVQEKQVEEGTESVTSDIGKTVEEQQNNVTTENVASQVEENSNKNTVTTNTTSINTTKQTSETSKKEAKIDIPDEPDTSTQTENGVTETKKEITFTKPTDGEIICEFAKDNLVYSETLKEWITHTAIDIKADKTSVVKSAADGVVKSIINDPRYGLTVVIEHDDGYETVYSNLLTAEFVVEGEEVSQGQTIGTVGNTASFESNMECHLHFELLKDGEYLDPSIYLK